MVTESLNFSNKAILVILVELHVWQTIFLELTSSKTLLPEGTLRMSGYVMVFMHCLQKRTLAGQLQRSAAKCFGTASGMYAIRWLFNLQYR